MEFELVSSFKNYRVTIDSVDYIVSNEWSETENCSQIVVRREDGQQVPDEMEQRILEEFYKQ